MSLRIFSFGDIHNDTTSLGNVISFINDAASQNKCDIVVQTGDWCSSVATSEELTDLRNNYLNNLTVPWFAVPGNHDISNSQCADGCLDHVGTPISCYYRTINGDPDWIRTFSKEGITYQLIGVSICFDPLTLYTLYWIFDFTQLNLSKTLPTILMNHGPIVIPEDTSCGSWTDNTLYAVEQNLKGQMDLLNILISYTGHAHASRQTIISNRLYITENTISESNERCTVDSTRFIGYTKITPINNTFVTEYQIIRYENTNGTVPPFVDPFPDEECTTPITSFTID